MERVYYNGAPKYTRNAAHPQAAATIEHRVPRFPRNTDKSRGLRHFSNRVCEKVKEKGQTNYNEVCISPLLVFKIHTHFLRPLGC